MHRPVHGGFYDFVHDPSLTLESSVCEGGIIDGKCRVDLALATGQDGLPRNGEDEAVLLVSGVELW
jgi:hypothetical protein